MTRFVGGLNPEIPSTIAYTTIIAEGVEMLDQFVRPRAEGRTGVQGFFFSKPAPAVEVPRLPRQFHAEKMEAV